MPTPDVVLINLESCGKVTKLLDPLWVLLQKKTGCYHGQ